MGDEDEDDIINDKVLMLVKQNIKTEEASPQGVVVSCVKVTNNSNFKAS